MTGLDRHLERWVVHHRTGWLDPVFVGLTRIGTFGAIWLLLAFVLALLWRRPWLFALVLGADVVADLVAYGIKVATGIERPAYRYARPKPLVHVPHDGSFPSGHTTTSFACATVLSVAAPRAAPAFLLLALAIGFSRIYVGAHYPYDVLGGIGLGLILGVVVSRALRQPAAARPRSSRGPRRG